MDIAFLVVATLSQGAWIFRWSLAASWLGYVMAGLMLWNAAMMQVGCRGQWLRTIVAALRRCAAVSAGCQAAGLPPAPACAHPTI